MASTITTECIVCLHPLQDASRRVLPCQHELCSTCHKTWRDQCLDNGNNFTCPFCRRVLEKADVMFTDDMMAEFLDPQGWTHYGNAAQDLDDGSTVSSFDSIDYGDYDDYSYVTDENGVRTLAYTRTSFEQDEIYEIDENGYVVPRIDPERDYVDYPDPFNDENEHAEG